jgi:hypothetical protein
LFFLDGSVHEVLGYDRVLEDAEVVAVTRYLGDRYPPVLGLLGPAVLKHKRGDAFIDPGVTAEDEIDGALGGEKERYIPRAAADLEHRLAGVHLHGLGEKVRVL